MNPNGPPRFRTRAVLATSAAWRGNVSGKKDYVAKVFEVRCENANGRRVLFGRYLTRDEAEAVAAALRKAGCRASVAATKEAP